ncbi:D-glycero-beta-D-manno-heptose-7-phosphate kinase [Sphingomonas naphthae]|uniref:Bifunctional protein HldE n=1 Tax=Sphingomonas naphthae TaxID=1813468 RepID=A0ABY7TQH6_9SPHN|nr:D-glycero-beta-D-manno-heptose-7-phosphate kinase [Sphingomonas naphthae]WCT75195.1 D-glycero-beta-D-manno-heptose-7-phosphate kinase [Sphingomonas naphthae]
MTNGLPDFESIAILVVGDVMLDRFMKGVVQRISPESPVPIIHLKATESVPGGAANVGRNISALGGRCTLIGCVGEDAAAAELAFQLSTCGRITPALIAEAGRPTIEKTRFVAQGQHLLRADREEPGDIAAATGQAIVKTVADQIGEHQVVVLSDYAKGVLTPEVVAGIIAVARAAGVPVVVDPKTPDFRRYAGATVVTPNAKEALAATGIDPHEDEGAEQAGGIALSGTDIEAILLTRAERGMSLLRPDQAPVHIPASARDVFDVVGAGDTVIATLSLCLGAGLALPEAATIANAAGGVVVGKRGTATVSRSELHEELARLSSLGMSSPNSKVADLDLAITRRRLWERDGLTVGFTNGCFDILHVGHVGILEFARAHCDRLIVAVNADSSVKRLKGPSRPINSESDRAQIIAALGVTDLVVVFEEDTPKELIEALQPDLLVKGADYTIDQIIGADTVLARGGTVLTYELVPGRSTTNIIARASAPAEAAE